MKGDLACASRGRPSHRRLPDRVRDRILHLARTTYAGFNDHHLCEKLREVEGFSLGRETLRRLLRSAGIASPRKRRAPTHRQRRLPRAREGEMLLLDASLHRWLEDRGPQLTLLGFLDDATRKVPVAEFFPTEDARDEYDPSLNLHEAKVRKVARTAEWYVAEKDWEGEWQVDGCLVWLRRHDGIAKVRYLPQIV